MGIRLSSLFLNFRTDYTNHCKGSDKKGLNLFARSPNTLHNTAMPEQVSFGQAIINFFTMFLGPAFIFESVAVVFLALQASGRYRYKRLNDFLIEFRDGFFLLLSTILTSCLGYSIGASTAIGYSSIAVISGLLLPSVIYLAIFSKGLGMHRTLRTLFFFSIAYLITESAHHYNILIGQLGNRNLVEFLFCFPYLALIIAGLGVTNLKIHHVHKPANSLMVTCYLIWFLTFLFAFFSSLIEVTVRKDHILLLILTFVLAALDFWVYYIYYHVDKGQRVIAALETEAQLNSAAAIMLRMNEESIARTTATRHDLKNTLGFVSELIQEGRYEQALEFLGDTRKKMEGELPIVDCGNAVVSSLMNLERRKAGYEGIELKYRLVVPPDLPIADTALCSLLTNIIDNAIEGTKDSGKEGYVDFSMLLQRSILRIHCSNPTSLKTVPTHSSKKGAGHGYGMTIIKNVVAELGGYVGFSVEEGQFIVDVIIGLDI